MYMVVPRSYSAMFLIEALVAVSRTATDEGVHSTPVDQSAMHVAKYYHTHQLQKIPVTQPE
jgi:hypothetical protein